MCLTPTEGGVLDLGYIDTSKFQGNLTYIPLSFNRWYNFNVLDIKISNYSLGLPSFVYWTTNDVIGSFIDSGTNIILMSPAIYTAFTITFQANYCDLPGVCEKNGFFDGSCVSRRKIDPFFSQFPTINFLAEDENHKIVELPVQPSAYLTEVGDQYCLGVAPVIGVGLVLGDVFLEGFYTVYDRVNLRVGFAPLTACT